MVSDSHVPHAARSCEQAPQPLVQLRQHAERLADLLLDDDVSSQLSGRSAAANLLVTFASLERVETGLLMAPSDAGMCGIAFESDRAAACATGLLATLQVQYSWQALEQLAASSLPGRASVDDLFSDGSLAQLRHYDCSAKGVAAVVPRLLMARGVGGSDGNQVCSDDLSSLTLTRRLRNKLSHGHLASIATRDYGGDSELLAAACSFGARVALFACQDLIARLGSAVTLHEFGPFCSRAPWSTRFEDDQLPDWDREWDGMYTVEFVDYVRTCHIAPAY